MSGGDVHTLASLKTWQSDHPCLAVLGHPIAHSLSPAMHHAALAKLAEHDPTFADWRYYKFDVPPEDLPAALPLFHEKGFRGLNLTIPHKVLAARLVARIDPAAAETGAVNTLRRTELGYEGFNTDSYGITQAVLEEYGLPLRGAHVILLGAGGAARGAAVACLREGCASLWIGNRSDSNLAQLLAVLEPVAKVKGGRLCGFPLDDPPAGLPSDALVINATSAGLKPGDTTPIDLSRLSGRPRIYDMIYNPAETPLLLQARALGLDRANGLSMLVHQGVRALELWTSRPVDSTVMLAACRRALAGA